MDIRRAVPADLPAVSEIYGREAREGHATFDLEPRPMELWQEKLTASGPPRDVGLRRSRPASLALHLACGFEEVGTMRGAGRKFDRWIDLTWLQKVLDRAWIRA